MSRHHKQRRPYGQASLPAPEPSPAAHQPAPPGNGATAPPGDTTAQLLALRGQIEETRREVNARLDALTQAVERLLPAHHPAMPQAAPSTAPTPAAPIDSQAPAKRAIRAGEEVYVPHLDGTYTVVEVSPSGHAFKVQAGAVRVQVRSDEVWALDDAPTPRIKGKGTAPAMGRQRPELSTAIPEIDLHGYSEEDAIITLELFLHHAFAQRTPRIRIIHGKGNGTLRAAVRRELARHPLVHAVDMGPQYRGDDGVTLADLDL